MTPEHYGLRLNYVIMSKSSVAIAEHIEDAQLVDSVNKHVVASTRSLYHHLRQIQIHVQNRWKMRRTHL